jgi:hypothetical protein
MQCFRVRNIKTGEVRYLDKMPHVRRYLLENSAVAEFLVVDHLEWNYKWQFIQMLNEAVIEGTEKKS